MAHMLIKEKFTPAAQGFTLPVILLISVGLMIVGLSLLQSTSSVRDSLDYQYQQRINNEAAEAGAIYANYCLSANNFTQTWGPANGKQNLTQFTNCSGNTLSYAPAYLLQNGTRRTGFSIGDLTVRSDGAIIFPSSGTYQQTRGGTSLIANSATTVRKQVVEWKVYQPSVSSSGTNKTCAIVSNELYCWGLNSNVGEDYSGNLGDGTTTNSLVPVKVRQDMGVLAGKVVSDVFSAQFHSCALAAGKVYCWGKNQNGQLGNGTTNDSTVPVEVTGALSGKTVTAIGGSGNTSCAIADSKIYCWGLNNRGQVGDNTTTTRTSPTLVSTTNLGGGYTATKIATSGSRSYNICAIADSKAWCWGNNEAGQIGNGSSGSTDVRVPTKAYDGGVLSGKTVTAISQDGYYNGSSSAYTHVCVVASGKAYCWGENNSGQLGRSNSTGTRTSDSNVPIAVYDSGVLSGKTVQDIVVGLRHSCALANSKVYCWGNNGSGQVGDATNSTRYVPTAVAENDPGLLNKNITAIGGGANRGCALAEYQAYCWGLNSNGQLGDGTQTSRNTPTESVFLRPKAPAYIF
mgnify:CR=1 FL=1